MKCARNEIDEETGRTCEHSDAILSDGSELPFGMMVWSAGLTNVKFVDGTDILEKGPTGRILTDRFLRVSLKQAQSSQSLFPSQGMGLAGRIYAIGDCAVNQDAPVRPSPA